MPSVTICVRLPAREITELNALVNRLNSSDFKLSNDPRTKPFTRSDVIRAAIRHKLA